MTASEAVTYTDSEKVIHLKIKFRIEKFEALMESTQPGEDLWSEGVSSELAPLAVWKLRVHPNGCKLQHSGNIGVFLWNTGLMDNIDATNHIYLVDGSGGNKIDVGKRSTDNFEKKNWGDCVSHDRMKEALQADGSLLVEADVEFPIPCDGKTEAEEKSTLQIQRTESGKKAVFKVQQTIKLLIEEFEALMESTKPGERSLRSEGVTSKLSPRAVWMLNVYPNGWNEEYRGNVGVSLWLAGLMKDNGETLNATCHIYLADACGNSKIDVVERCTRNFGKGGYARGRRVDHEQVKKALHADGSLLVAADVEFLVPCDSEVEDYEYDQLEQERNELVKDNKRLEGQLKMQKEESEKLGTALEEAVGEQDGIKKQLDETVDERDGIKKQLDDALKKLIATNEKYEAEVRGWLEAKEAADKHAKALMDEMASLKEKICKGCAPSGDEAQKALCVKYSPESHSNRAPSEQVIKIGKPSIGKVLNVGNVIAMAMHAYSNSLDTRSAQLLKEACLELIAREWDVVYESAEWKELEKDLPMLAVDLTFEAATLADTHTAGKFKKACLKLIVNRGKTVYESAAWKELKRTKPEFALDLAEGATAVSVEKSDGAT